MAKVGFEDANGQTVSLGTMVKHRDGRYAEVIDITQDGDVTLKFLDGDSLQTKWKQVAALPPSIVAELNAENEREQASQKQWGQRGSAPATTGKYENLTYDEAKTLAQHRAKVLINDLLIGPSPAGPWGQLPNDIAKARQDLADIAALVEQAYKEASKP